MAIKIRAVDIKILNLLIMDASLTNKEIAVKIDKSETTVAVHRRNLVESGLIVKFTIILDDKKLTKAINKFVQIAPNSYDSEDLTQLNTELENTDDLSTYSFTVHNEGLEVEIITDVRSSHRKIQRKIYEFDRKMTPNE